MNSLIIEVRGGVVQEVYSDAQDIRVTVVDWDAGNDPETNAPVEIIPCNL